MGHQNYYTKLAKRYYGPYQIYKPIKEMAYKLRLSSTLMIHNAFDVSLLKPQQGDLFIELVTKEPPTFEDLDEILRPKTIL